MAPLFGSEFSLAPMRTDANATEKAQLLTRIRLTLDAIERAEPPSPTWAEFRALGERSANNLRTLRDLAREVAVLASMLPGPIRAELDTALTAAGIDLASERASDLAAIAAVRARGRIRSEAEYRRVQAYADQIGPDEARQEEYLALGALLDEFATRGAI